MRAIEHHEMDDDEAEGFEVETEPQPDRSERVMTALCLIGAAVLGMAAAPFWPLLFSMVGVALQRSDRHVLFARRYGPAMGRGEAWALIACASLARAGLYCLAAYGVGAAIAALWSLV